MLLFRDKQGNYEIIDVVMNRKQSGSYVINGITSLHNTRYIVGELSFAECWTIYLQLKNLLQSKSNIDISNIIEYI